LALAPKVEAASGVKGEVLVMTLADDGQGNWRVKSLDKTNGLVPDYKNYGASEYLPIRVKTASGEKEYDVPVTREVITEGTDKEGKLSGSLEQVKKVEVTAIVPYVAGAEVAIKETANMATGQNKKVNLQIKLPTTGDEATVNGQKVVLKTARPLGTVSGYSVEMLFDGNPAETDPSKTLDIVLVATKFPASEYQVFRDFAKREIDATIGMSSFPGKAPFNTAKFKSKMKIWMVLSPFGLSDQDPPIRTTLTQLGVPLDQLIMVINEDGRSNASLGGGYVNLYIKWGMPERNLVLAHELAHSFGSVLDEYVDYYASKSYYALSRDLYYYGRNCKDDLTEPWMDNLATEAYPGCEYGYNNYKSTKYSLMDHIDDDIEFNEISKKMINNAFGGYLEGEIAAEYTHKVVVMNYSDDPNSEGWGSIGVMNYGYTPFSYSLKLSQQVDGVGFTEVVNKVKEGDPSGWHDYHSVSVDYSKFPLGRRDLSFDLKITNSNGKSMEAKVPLIIIKSDGSEVQSININMPEVTTMTRNQTLPVAINYQSPVAGWKRVEYYVMFPPRSFGPDDQTFSMFSSIVRAPYETKLIASEELLSDYMMPGRYKIWARALDYSYKEVESQPVYVDLRDANNSVCNSNNYYNYPSACSATYTNSLCYKGSATCGEQYCCPVVTPTRIPPTSTPVPPTATPTPKGRYCGDEFRCYVNLAGEHKWFVDGYVQDGFTLEEDGMAMGGGTYCGGVPMPWYKGKSMGDGNCDGLIEGADFSLWRREFIDISKTQPTKSLTWEADFDGNEVVDGVDYSLWRRGYQN
jgi:hypothetical protein